MLSVDIPCISLTDTFINPLSLSYIFMDGIDGGFGGSNQRKLMIRNIEGILKELLPKDRDLAVADVMYKTGLTEVKVREYLRLFFRIGKLEKKGDDDKVLIWCSED